MMFKFSEVQTAKNGVYEETMVEYGIRNFGSDCPRPGWNASKTGR